MPPEDRVFSVDGSLCIFGDQVRHVFKRGGVMVERMFDGHAGGKLFPFSPAEYAEPTAVEPGVAHDHVRSVGQHGGGARRLECDSVDHDVSLSPGQDGQIRMFGPGDLLPVVARGGGNSAENLRKTERRGETAMPRARLFEAAVGEKLMFPEQFAGLSGGGDSAVLQDETLRTEALRKRKVMRCNEF